MNTRIGKALGGLAAQRDIAVGKMRVEDCPCLPAVDAELVVSCGGDVGAAEDEYIRCWSELLQVD